MDEVDKMLKDAGFGQPKSENFCEIGDISCKHFKSGKCFAKNPAFEIDEHWECPCMDEQEEIEEEKDDTDWEEYRKLCCGENKEIK